MKPCFFPSEILLPKENKADMSVWGCIACDQFTSEPEYWNEVEKTVGDKPSTFKLILPEARLDGDREKITEKINETMREYQKDILVAFEDSMIYVERRQPSGGIRRGIVGTVDLEAYSYLPGSKSQIRATEGTVLDRIPPRVEIRRGAAIELPHVMLLIDDPEKTVIEPLASDKTLKVAYDTDLMVGGGHITGKFLSKEQIDRVQNALQALGDKRGDDKMLFAVGDGNHSLAAAKAFYEEIKAKLGDAAKDHPARYALVEVVNLHDDALVFEPIYRAVFGCNAEELAKSFENYAAKLCGGANPQKVTVMLPNGTQKTVNIAKPESQLTVGSVQNFLDDYKKSHDGIIVDYIHGEDSLAKLVAKGAVGFLFDGMKKNELFTTVEIDGALPRKTFSMGHAKDKRFYFEARKIK